MKTSTAYMKFEDPRYIGLSYAHDLLLDAASDADDYPATLALLSAARLLREALYPEVPA